MSLAAKMLEGVRSVLAAAYVLPMSADCCSPDQTITSRRTVLWVALAMKAGMFLTEIFILPLTD
jgi:hypothetical protein